MLSIGEFLLIVFILAVFFFIVIPIAIIPFFKGFKSVFDDDEEFQELKNKLSEE